MSWHIWNGIHHSRLLPGHGHGAASTDHHTVRWRVFGLTCLVSALFASVSLMRATWPPYYKSQPSSPRFLFPFSHYFGELESRPLDFDYLTTLLAIDKTLD